MRDGALGEALEHLAGGEGGAVAFPHGDASLINGTSAELTNPLGQLLLSQILALTPLSEREHMLNICETKYVASSLKRRSGPSMWIYIVL